MEKADIINKVRIYVRDHEELNTLLESKETSDETMDLFVDLALEDFNTTPPYIGDYELDNFPSLQIILYGTIVQLLLSAGLLYMRNGLNYVDPGGISIGDKERHQGYLQWAQTFGEMYETRKRQLKGTINFRRGWGSAPSGYGAASTITIITEE